MKFFRLKPVFAAAFSVFTVLVFFQNCNNLSVGSSNQISTGSSANVTLAGPRLVGQFAIAPSLYGKTDFQCGEKVVLTAQSYSEDGRLWGCDSAQCLNELDLQTGTAEMGNGLWKKISFGRYIFTGENQNTSGADRIHKFFVADSKGTKSAPQEFLMKNCYTPPPATGGGSNGEGGGTSPTTGPEVYVKITPVNERNETISAFDPYVRIYCGDAAKSAACYASIGCNPSTVDFGSNSLNPDGTFDLPTKKCAALGQDVWCQRSSGQTNHPMKLSSLANGSKLSCPKAVDDFVNAPQVWHNAGRAMQHGKPFLGAVYVDGSKLIENKEYDGLMEVRCGNPDKVYNGTAGYQGQLIMFDKNGNARFRTECDDPATGGGRVWAACFRKNATSYYPEDFKIITVEQFISGTVLSCD